MVPATDVDTSAPTSLDDSEQPTISTAMTTETRITFERTVMRISVNLAERVILITKLLVVNGCLLLVRRGLMLLGGLGDGAGMSAASRSRQ
jgi:hypothetical protein